MSVLVKGMKMPKACFWRDKNGSLTTCPLCDADGYCGANGKQRCLVPENEMPNDCPLIELPSHGDLIDRDVVRGSIKPWSPEDEGNGCTFDTVKKLMHTMLDRASTIIPAEGGESCQF